MNSTEHIVPLVTDLTFFIALTSGAL